jgi:secondary thiamine-phosphate synthase enzyme
MREIRAQTQNISTTQRSEMIDVTQTVQQVLDSSGIIDGFALVFVPHTTAAVTINENADPDVKSDLLQKLDTLIPKDEAYYRHFEGNSDSHVKTALVGNTVTVFVDNHRLVLGQSQGIYFCEFDGPRQRQFIVKVVDCGGRTDLG